MSKVDGLSCAKENCSKQEQERVAADVEEQVGCSGFWGADSGVTAAVLAVVGISGDVVSVGSWVGETFLGGRCW